MQQIRFGRTNIHVPAISLGTWGYSGAQMAGSASVGWKGHDDALAREALLAAYRNGITHWDTADVYGDGRSEQLLGSMWDEVPRDKIFLATKVGWDFGPMDEPYEPKYMRKKFEQSLRNLRTDVFDLYYFHHCNFGDNFERAREVMHRVRDEGKVRFIGLSDWSGTEIMKYIARVDPDVVQPYRNVVDDDYESSGLKSWVDTHDLGVAFFSSLKHGLLFGKYDAPKDYGEGDYRTRVADFKDPEAIERYKRAAAAMRERFVDHAEPVLFAATGALLTDNPTACCLLGMRNPKQVAAAAAAGGEALSREDAAWVRKMYRGQ